MLRDWRTAPVDERLRAMLGFLADVTLRPDELDVEPLRAQGISRESAIDALLVAWGFNLIDRLADAFGFEPISTHIGADRLLEYEAAFLERGYV